MRSGGGWQAIRYAIRTAFRVGPLRFYRAMRSKNACKTCAFGMGGQLGGMRNEAGHFPEVCKKSMQAMAADMRGKIEPRLFSTYSIADFRTFSSREMEEFGRLVDPLIVDPGASHYRVATWDEALQCVADALDNAPPERAFFYASGRSSNEAGFLLQLFARAYGTNHVNNCSFYCHQASGVGLKDSIGTATATIELDDIDKCDLLFLIGGNPASNHPRLLTMLMKLRRRDGKIIVVNPLREPGLESFRVPSNVSSMLFGSEIASRYVQPLIGGDIALMVGVAKCLIERDWIDHEYIEQCTEHYDLIESQVNGSSWRDIEDSSGVLQPEIEAIAEEYARSERVVFAWTMGITHHEHGTDNVQWIANLALLRGMVGKVGAGLLPIRGHSNVQGMGTVGVTPAMTKAAVEQFDSLGLKPPAFQGHDTMAAMEAAGRGEMSFGLCLGGNLYGANPDSSFASEALGKLDTLVYLSTSLNTGHAHGLGKRTIILPVLVRDEEQQSTTQESMFSYVRLSDGGPSRYEGPRAECDILADIADRTLKATGSIEWTKLRDHEQIRGLIARLVPGLEPIETMGKTRKEFHIPGRLYHEPKFNTPSGKAAFCDRPIPARTIAKPGELQLMTIRSEGQFNTVVYEEEDLYRGQVRRDVILMHPEDIETLGLQTDMPARVRSESGEMFVLARPIDIARGCAAMYYPEANVLVGRKVDARSKTPSFKSVVVSVSPAGAQSISKADLLRSKPVEPSSRSRMKSC